MPASSTCASARPSPTSPRTARRPCSSVSATASEAAMFEAHFGFSAPPFQLSPDPGFFFESQGHGHALRYMRYGIYQGEGFVVVTGEIGSGKTLLVRTLLDGLSPADVAA